MAVRTLHLQVNGSAHAVLADAATPLLYLLRNDLNLRAAHFGCGLDQCGSCHVLVDGKSLASCTIEAGNAEGKTITTLEGFTGPGDRLHPLQQAVLDEQAAQCGYCLSGMLVSAVALLNVNTDPSDSEIRLALDKHLCRCGSHNRFVRAVQKAAQVLRVAP